MYSNVIGEKRAKDIISYVISQAAQQTKLDKVSVLNLFISKGESIVNTHLLSLLDEVNSLNTAKSIRLNYDDSVRLREYFGQFLPQFKTDLLLEVVKELNATDYNNTEELKTRFSGLKIKAAKAIDNYKKANNFI